MTHVQIPYVALGRRFWGIVYISSTHFFILCNGAFFLLTTLCTMASSFLLLMLHTKRACYPKLILNNISFFSIQKPKLSLNQFFALYVGFRMFLNIFVAPYPNFSFVHLLAYSLALRLVNRMRVGHCLCQIFDFLTFGSHLRL